MEENAKIRSTIITTTCIINIKIIITTALESIHVYRYSSTISVSKRYLFQRTENSYPAALLRLCLWSIL